MIWQCLHSLIFAFLEIPITTSSERQRNEKLEDRVCENVNQSKPIAELLFIVKTDTTTDKLSFTLDIDECKESIDDCVEGAKCNNTLGSYNCLCQEGYEGDGKNDRTKDAGCSPKSSTKSKRDIILIIALSEYTVVCFISNYLTFCSLSVHPYCL